MKPIINGNVKTKMCRLVSLFVLVTFISFQTVWAQEFRPLEPADAQNTLTAPASKAVSVTTAGEGTLPSLETFPTTIDFLRNDTPLKKTDAVPENQEAEKQATAKAEEDQKQAAAEKTNLDKTASLNYEYERYDFKDAVEQLRPEYSAAVIVKDLSAKDLQELSALSFETGIIVLNGEMVLFTTGSGSEIGASPAAAEILKKASFVSHIHPQQASQQGPSRFDLDHAVAAPETEYVITDDGAYAYNRQGLQNAGEKIGLDKISKLIEQAAQRADADQAGARSDLNALIRDMDAYNEIPVDQRETFRRGTPVPISTLDDLRNMRNDLTGEYYLTNDIDAADTANWNGGAGFDPIGTRGNAFHGIFNGNGFKITNLHINRPNQDYVGLFGSVEDSGHIENIKLENTVIAGRNNVGSLTGYMFLATVANSSAEAGAVNGGDRVGGLIGESYNGLGVHNSHSNLAVQGNDMVGGIVGKLWDGVNNDLIQSYALGTVNGRYEVGGLAGYSKSGDLIRSYATGNVTGQDRVGGLVGDTTENAGIHNSYYVGGLVSGTTSNVGGIAGFYGSYDDGISNTYFGGRVTSADGAGGFLGTYSAGVISNNYWDTTLNSGLQDTVNRGDMAGITGVNTAAMQTQGTYNGWDFSHVWILDGYPKLQPYYAISTLDELRDMKNNLSGKYYLLNDIDAADTANWNGGAGFEPIGTPGDAFHGIFDGNGFKITNLHINRPNQDYVGLFGAVKESGSIDNLNVENARITGRNNVGSLTGYLFLATINNSSADWGTVTGSDRVGGLIGESYNGLGVHNSHSNVSVLGNNEVGGIVGKLWDGNGNDVVDSYALGTVYGVNEIGGLAGYSKSGDLIRSYATGNVTGQNSVGGLVGQTTENAGIHDSYYAVGLVSGTSSNVGGISGWYGSYDDGISNTYFAGRVTSAGGAGGFLGTYNAGVISNNYWDTTLNPGLQDSVNRGDMAGITGLNTPTMQTQSTYTGWDFSHVWVMDGYPRFNLSGDTTAPTGSFSIQGGAEYTNSYNLSLSFNVSEPIKDFKYAVDSDAWSDWLPYQDPAGILIPQGEGERVIRVKLRDLAGNESLELSDSIKIDTTAPAGVIALDNNAAFTNHTDGNSVALNVTDNLSGIDRIRFREDGGAWQDWIDYASLTNQTYNGLFITGGEANRLIEAQVQDKANNVGLLNDPIYMDNVKPPTGSITINGGNPYTNNAVLNLTLTGQDNGTGVDSLRLSTDGGTTWSPNWSTFQSACSSLVISGTLYTCQFSLNTAALPDGNVRVFYQVRDAAGNVRQVDTFPIALSGFQNGQFVFNIHDPLGALKYDIQYATDLNAQNWQTLLTNVPVSGTGTTTVLLTPPAPNAFFRAAIVQDFGGAYAQSIVLDRVAPTGTINFANNAQYTGTRLVHLNLTAADAGSQNIQMQFRDALGNILSGWENFAAAKDLTLVGPEGTQTVFMDLRDAANNQVSYSKQIALDLTAPAAAIGSVAVGNPSLGQTYRDARFNLTGVSDAVSGLNALSYQIDGGAAVNVTLPAGTGFPVDLRLPEGWGDHNIQITLTDRAGNFRVLTQTVTIAVSAYLADVDFKYFLNPYDPIHGAFEATHSYPNEGYNQRLYTQPTDFGFTVQLLGNMIAKRVVVDYLTRDQAIAILKNMITHLLADQMDPTIGVMGLLPWMNFDSSAQDWRRDHDYGTGKDTINGRRFMMGDNSNMSAAFAAALGALAQAQDNAAGDVASIKTKIQTFLNNQTAGYQCLASSTNNTADGAVRRGIIISSSAGAGFAVTSCSQVFNGGNVAFVNTSDTSEPNTGLPVAYEQLYGSEFRAGILFAVLNYNLSDSVYKNLTIEIENYVKQDFSTIYTVSPVDGGAFQMLWPTLTTPEALNGSLARMDKSYLDVALDYATRTSEPAFLSAAYGTSGYLPNIGIAEIAHNSTGRNQTSTSVYTMGAAYALDPARMTPFLQAMLQRYPGLVTGHGLWEGVDMQTSAGTVIQQQIIANVSSFILGILGTGASDMLEYLSAAQETRLNTSLWKPAGADVDAVSASTSAFSWAGPGEAPDVTWTKSGDTYRVQAGNLINVGTAFQLNTINASGKRLLISYRASLNAANATAANLSIEFKDPNGLKIRQKINQVVLKNTGPNVINTVLIDLPEFIGTSQISEIVFVLTGSGGSLDVTFEDVDLISSNSSTPLNPSGGGGGTGGRPANPTPQEIVRSQTATLTSYLDFAAKAKIDASLKIVALQLKLDALNSIKIKSKIVQAEIKTLTATLNDYKAVLQDIAKLITQVNQQQKTLTPKNLMTAGALDTILINFYGIYAFLYAQ